MRRRASFVAVTASCLLLSLPVGRAAPSAPRLPPLEAPYPLPPLPERSPRNASYTIEAALDPERHTIEGRLALDWRNVGEVAVQRVPFHLYWNAFRNTLSTSARGEGSRAARFRDERDFGYLHVKRIALEGSDLTPTLRYLQPDDANRDDRTLAEVDLPRPVAPGATARFEIEWSSQLPHGCVGRAGWIHDFFFVVQWFPKIAAMRPDGFNRHQFHATGEFFADYGTYDVTLRLPRGLLVGATGRLVERRATANGELVRFVQEDVHDFAWCAGRRLLEKTARFEDPGYPPVAIRLLVQPERAHLADRYLEATRVALRAYGAWSAPYPYPQLTVVDPPWFSAAVGMEYPTLFTGGAQVWSPAPLRIPEEVTVHEAGHQFWYGLLGNNEFEEAWLDEGFNSYHEQKALALFYQPSGWGRRYFGGRDQRGRPRGIPVLAPGVFVGRGEDEVMDLRRHGRTDVMARRSFDYPHADAYYASSYDKPALVLQTLENLVGDETMTQILRTYARRYRFAHPTTADFIAVVNEVSGRDYGWFFDETFFSSGLCDYAIAVESAPSRRLEGFGDSASGPARVKPETTEPARHDTVVMVRRLGEVRMPVELEVEFEDGRRVRESWDGQGRWARFEYRGQARPLRALVDPERTLAIDVDVSNNAWISDKGASRRAAARWAARFLLWLQDLLELHLVLA